MLFCSWYLKGWFRDLWGIVMKLCFSSLVGKRINDIWCLYQLCLLGHKHDDIFDKLKTMHVSSDTVALLFLPFHWTSIQSLSSISQQKISSHLSKCIPFQPSSLTFNICCLFKTGNSHWGKIQRHENAQHLGNNYLSQQKFKILNLKIKTSEIEYAKWYSTISKSIFLLSIWIHLHILVHSWWTQKLKKNLFKLKKCHMQTLHWTQ
jgi:hypothetical protein